MIADQRHIQREQALCTVCGSSWGCDHIPAVVIEERSRRLPASLLLLREQERCEHYWVGFLYKPKGEQCCKCRMERLPDGTLLSGMTLSADALYLAQDLARKQEVSR